MIEHKLLSPSLYGTGAMTKPILGFVKTEENMRPFTNQPFNLKPPIAFRSHAMSIIDHFFSDLVVVERADAEKSSGVIHFISYCPIYYVQPETGKIYLFIYERGKGIGESRLIGDYSIGIGGHMDYNSKNVTKPVLARNSGYPNDNLLVRNRINNFVANSFFLEMCEEVNLLQCLKPLAEHAIETGNDVVGEAIRGSGPLEDSYSIMNDHPFALSVIRQYERFRNGIIDMVIYDPSNEVGKVHMGLTNFVPFAEDQFTTSANLAMQEEELISRGFYSVDEIMRTDLFSKLENWSAAIVKSIANDEDLQMRLRHRYQPAGSFKRIGTTDPATGLNANIDYEV